MFFNTAVSDEESNVPILFADAEDDVGVDLAKWSISPPPRHKPTGAPMIRQLCATVQDACERASAVDLAAREARESTAAAVRAIGQDAEVWKFSTTRQLLIRVPLTLSTSRRHPSP